MYYEEIWNPENGGLLVIFGQEHIQKALVYHYQGLLFVLHGGAGLGEP